MFLHRTYKKVLSDRLILHAIICITSFKNEFIVSPKLFLIPNNARRYVLSTTTLDKEIGINLLTKAIQVIQDRITAKGGKMDVKMEPRAVSVREETELQAMMDRLALENEEMDGDAPEED